MIDFKTLFPHASKDTLDLNPSASIGISYAEPSELSPTLESKGEGKAQGPGCPLVRFTLRRVKLLDVDAKYGSTKDLLDGLQYAGLIRGDREGQIRLEVIQEKVSSFKEEQTIIEVEI